MILGAATPVWAGVGGTDERVRGSAGEPAPPFEWEVLIQRPSEAKLQLEALRGRVVVVDFWSIECGPCIITIPLWNRVVDRFAEKAVTFVAVSEDRNAKAVRRFLEKHPMRGHIVLDSDRSMRHAYGIKEIPATVVIDRKGVVVGWTEIETLEEDPDILERVLRGESVRLRQVASPPQPDPLADVFASLDEEPTDSNEHLCLILIRPASGETGWGWESRRERRRDNGTLREIIKWFYPVRGGALHFEFEPPDDRYDVIFSWPSGDIESGEALFRQAIETTFDVVVTVEERLTDVYVMTVDEDRVASWDPIQRSVRRDPDTGMTAPNQAILERMKKGEEFFLTMGTVADQLTDGFSYALDAPVIDETGVEGAFTFCFPWSKSNSTVADTIDLAKKHLGVTLTRSRRKVNAHVVRRRAQAVGHESDRSSE